MSFNVKPYKDIIALSKEKVDEALAPIRAKAARSRANLETAKIEEELVSLEGAITSLCADKDLDFDKIINKLNEYDLNTRRLEQINKIVEDLFPEKQ